MTYQNKFLKSKNKYLDFKKILGGTKSRSSVLNQTGLNNWERYYNSLNFFSIKYDIFNNIKYNKTKQYNVSNLFIKIGYAIPSKIHITKFLESLRDFNITGNLTFEDITIETLPDLFCDIIIGGNLNLSHNQLETLPKKFGNMSVRGDLNLSHNQLTTLPKSFGNISVYGDLFLNHNKLKTLSKNFENIYITGDLNLSHNQLKQLPNINKIYIEGKFNLFKNQLYEFPNNFNNIYVNDLNLGENNLRELLENFGNVRKFICEGDLNLSYNLLKVLPQNFGEIHVDGDLNLSYNLLKILPTDFKNVGKKILLNNNYIISAQPPDNCVRKKIQKNYCHLDNQTIEGLESYKECSNCKQIKTCKKCAICKNEWYCSENCEKKEWFQNQGNSHRHMCNNIINTTFIISAHGEMKYSETPIKDTNNMSIITLSLLGKNSNFLLSEPLIDIYTNNNSLFNNNDKTLTHTEHGGTFYNDYKNSLEVNLMNRLNEENKKFNNISLHFIDKRPNIAEKIRIHCFKKRENKNIEIIDNYLYDVYNNKIADSVDIINDIVNNERQFNNNRGHITFIFIACRGLSNVENENKIMRVNSVKTKMNTYNVLNSQETVNLDILAEKEGKNKAEDKQKEEELENKFASQSENQFNNSKILIDELKKNKQKFKSLDV